MMPIQLKRLRKATTRVKIHHSNFFIESPAPHLQQRLLLLIKYCYFLNCIHCVYNCCNGYRGHTIILHPFEVCSPPRIIGNSLLVGVHGWNHLVSTVRTHNRYDRIVSTRFGHTDSNVFLSSKDEQKYYDNRSAFQFAARSPPSMGLKRTSKNIYGISSSSLMSSSSPTITTEDKQNGVKNVRLIPLVQLTHELQDLLQQQQQQKQQQTQMIGVEGYVTHRRSFGSSLAFIDLVQGENLRQTPTSTNVATSSLQVLLKRQTYDHSRTKSSFASLLKSIYPGMKLYMEGQASPTDNEGQVVFMVKYIQILGLSRNPIHLRGILQKIRLDDDECIEKKENFGFLDEKGGERIKEGDEEPKTGLSLEDFHSSLCVGKDIQKMKRVLLGTEEITDLLSSKSSSGIQSGVTVVERLIKDDARLPSAPLSQPSPPQQQYQQQHPTNKHSFAKIARTITDNLPKDPHYPLHTLLQLSQRNYKSVQSGSKNSSTSGIGKSGKTSGKEETENSKKQDNIMSVLPIAPSNIGNIPKRVQRIITLRQQKRDVREDIDNNVVGERLTGDPMITTTFSMKTSNDNINDNISAVVNDDLVTIAGLVQNRRRFCGSITMLEVLLDDSSSSNISGTVEGNSDTTELGSSSKRFKCVMHPSTMDDVTVSPSEFASNKVPESPVDVYGNLLPPGARVLLQGYWSTTIPCKVNRTSDSDSASQEPILALWVTNAYILRSSWRPSILRHFLTLLGGGGSDANHTNAINKKETKSGCYYPFNLDEIVAALNLPGGHKEARELRKVCAIEGATEIQWRAAEISRRLQGEGSRVGALTNEMEAALTKFLQVREDWPFKQVGHNVSDSVGYPAAIFSKKATQTLDNATGMNTMGSTLVKSREGSRWQRAKRPQLEWMMNQIQEVVRAHPDYKKRPLNILDIGGGRGHLANYLATLGNDVVNVNVIDIDDRTVKNGMVNAQRKNLTVRYKVGDASSTSMISDLLDGTGQEKFDVVVALHACGALSDVALGHASMDGAAFVITPCCYRSNPHLLVRSSDGKMVTPSTWQGVEACDLEALKRVAELQGDIHTAGLGMHSICAIRVKAAKFHYLQVRRRNHTNTTLELEVQIKAFPMRFSTRNFCIVGKVSQHAK